MRLDGQRTNAAVKNMGHWHWSEDSPHAQAKLKSLKDIGRWKMHGPREFGADGFWKYLLNSQVHLTQARCNPRFDKWLIQADNPSICLHRVTLLVYLRHMSPSRWFRFLDRKTLKRNSIESKATPHLFAPGHRNSGIHVVYL